MNKEIGKEVGYEIRTIHQMIHRKMTSFRQEGEIELTFVQMRTIKFLMHSKGREVFQKDLEKELEVRRSTATEIVNVLERDGYIKRQSVEYDARLKQLVLTDKAIQMDKRMHAHMERLESSLIKDISEEDMKVFFRVTSQIKKNLE